jgi:16S rRNA (uracil1498-N3)-methyltransferase
MHLFYTPDITSNCYSLNEEESKHCAKVLRLKEGEIIYLVDGNGGFYTSSIKHLSPKKCEVEIIEKKENYGKRPYYVHLAIAPTKNIERFEWFLEKATEIGIDEISPIICQRSERKIIKDERLHKIITAAVKQSIKAYHPKLNTAVSFTDFLKKEISSQKLIAHCLNKPKELLKSVLIPNGNYTILIGPEGDFTENEITQAIANSYKEISLGESRLRTETAGISACFTAFFINQ